MTPLAQICSLTEAAAILKLSEKRVLVFIDEGRIKAKKLKREWAIDLASVKACAKVPRPTGKYR